MRSSRALALPITAVVAAAILAGLAIFNRTSIASLGLAMELDRGAVPANGAATVVLVVRSNGGDLDTGDVSLAILEGARRARIVSTFADGGALKAVVRVGILPGPVTLEARAKGIAPAQVRFVAVLDPADRAEDGTPDFLRLDEPGDREAFRRWFRFLAEAQAFRKPEDVPHEINDCAALLRFSYREALREHDGAWARALGLPRLPTAAGVRKYRYPYTPLGAALFRVEPGAFRSDDLTHGVFAEFADADSLRKFNTHFVTRDIAKAQPGDLLFFRQLEQNSPFHAMVLVGPSELESGVQQWIVYHTGPIGESRGEIRRVTVDELLRHPSPRWRPVPGNPNFLGVYRWNILRQAD